MFGYLILRTYREVLTEAKCNQYDCETNLDVDKSYNVLMKLTHLATMAI
jgi:hypothetical protein